MKFFNWKSFLVTSAVCLLPILLGVLIWDKLPNEIAIHFNFYGVPDNFASKGFAVFGMPALMVLMQAFCCVINDIQAKKHGLRAKFERVMKWIIPCMTVLIQIMIFGYSLGWDLDIRKAAMCIVGTVFVVMGNYMPKFDYIKNYDIAAEKARKINRFVGYGMVILGILFYISIFLLPIASVICLFLLIPHIIVSIVYGVKVAKR